MKIVSETSLRYFAFWSGAKDTAEYLTPQDLDQIEFVFDEIYPDGMTDTQVNDIFWFERDFIAECLGYKDWEKFVNKEDEDEDSEDEDFEDEDFEDEEDEDEEDEEEE